MPVITHEVVAVSLGRPLSDAEVAQVDQWIGDAELLIGARLGDLAELDQDLLKFVVREAVIARLRNPDGYQSETIDDYTYRLPAETRRITILDEWWRLLRPVEASDAFSVRPGFESDATNPVSGWA